MESNTNQRSNQNSDENRDSSNGWAQEPLGGGTDSDGGHVDQGGSYGLGYRFYHELRMRNGHFDATEMQETQERNV